MINAEAAAIHAFLFEQVGERPLGRRSFGSALRDLKGTLFFSAELGRVGNVGFAREPPYL